MPPPVSIPNPSAAAATPAPAAIPVASVSVPVTKPKPTLIKPPSATVATKPPAASARPVKTFSVVEWSGEGEGKKIILYGPNGMGKTTLAAMAPDAVFIGLDDGGRETRHPKTGAKLRAIPGVESFYDLRDALHQTTMFPRGSTLILDTVTRAEELIKQFVLATVKKEGKGERADSLEDYGYGKGFSHLTDASRLLLGDLDPLVRSGVNVILLAQQTQATVSNLEGIDYSQDGPALTSQPKSGMNVRTEFCSWSDHIFRLGYADPSVKKANERAAKGKASGTTDRYVFTEPQIHFVAKNRMNGTLPAIMPFATRDDDSIWRAVFNGEVFCVDPA